MPPFGDWNIFGEVFGDDFIKNFYDKKPSEENQPQEHGFVDLGYAVVVDDDGNEIKNH